MQTTKQYCFVSSVSCGDSNEKGLHDSLPLIVVALVPAGVGEWGWGREGIGPKNTLSNAHQSRNNANHPFSFLMTHYFCPRLGFLDF